MLLTVADVRALIETDRTDAELLTLLDREAATLTRRFGDAGDGVATRSETLGGGGVDLFLASPLLSVSSVQERSGIGSPLQPVASDRYILWSAQARLTRTSGVWGVQVVVQYVPVDDRDRYRQALLDLLRLTIQRSAMRAESVAGEYSYTAPDWEAERDAIYRRLRFTSV